MEAEPTGQSGWPPEVTQTATRPSFRKYLLGGCTIDKAASNCYWQLTTPGHIIVSPHNIYCCPRRCVVTACDFVRVCVYPFAL